MSNKTQLEANNVALDGYIARINAAKEIAAGLPEAGGSGGGSVETCTGTIKSSGLPNTNSVWFLNANLQPESCTPGSKIATTFTAVKGSFVYINGTITTNRTLNGVTQLYSSNYNIVVSVDSDGFSIVT
jgi:hypothetical protein